MIPIRYNLRSLVVRKSTALATAFGVALVVFVLASSLMLVAGVKETLAAGGHADTAIVLRKGAENELSSNIDSAQVGTILTAPGVKRDGAGKPIGVGEVIAVCTMEKVGIAGSMSNVTLRGVTADGMAFRPEIKIVSGRAPKPGTAECLVGASIIGRFGNLELGKSFDLRKNRPVTVVGTFTAGGSSHESEIWVDIDALRAAYARTGAVSSVRVKLESAAAFDGFRAAIEGQKQFGYIATRETAFLEKQSSGTSMLINVLGTMISIFFSMGAMIGAMITMYAAIASRQREIGILRAIGFTRSNVLLSFLFESVVLSAVGGAVGLLAAMGMGFVKFSMMNFSTWSEMVFTFTPTPAIMVQSLLFAIGMGLFGGLLPAIHAARIAPVKAMRGQ